MVYVPWLADAARTTGYRVVEVAGWRSRGHGGMRLVEGVVGHHTATSARAKGDYPSLGIVTNGRSDLAGPLANLGLGRDGTVYVIAAGTAWHAGASAWAGFRDLNDEFLGIEAESPGDGTWTAAQRDCYPKLVGALLRYMNRDKTRYAGHKDVCLPKGRKIDPAGIDTTWMQNTAANYLHGGGGSAPTTPDRNKRIIQISGGTQMRTMPKGGGQDPNNVRWETFAMSVLYEHDIIFAPTSHALILRQLNTWKQQTTSNATTDAMRPGGVGDLLKGKEWHVQKLACKSFRVPKGVGKVDVAYWCDGPVEVTIEPVL